MNLKNELQNMDVLKKAQPLHQNHNTPHPRTAIPLHYFIPGLKEQTLSNKRIIGVSLQGQTGLQL